MLFNSNAIRFEPPTLNEDELVRALDFGWAIKGTLSSLSGERDQNRLIETDNGQCFVLKVSSLVERSEIVRFQTEALTYLARTLPDMPLPRVKLGLEDKAIVEFKASDGNCYLVRLLSFVPGQPMENFPASAQTNQAAALGHFMGKICNALTSFHFDLGDYVMPWDISKGLILNSDLHKSGFGDVEKLVLPHIDYFRSQVIEKVPTLRQQIIHNDAHPGNVLLSEGGDQLVGLIDFGDMVHAPVLQEAAVPMSKLMAMADNPIVVGEQFISAFNRVMPLKENELTSLMDFILVRAALTIMIADYVIHHYDLATSHNLRDYKQIVGNFERLSALDKSEVMDAFLSTVQ